MLNAAPAATSVTNRRRGIRLDAIDHLVELVRPF
jgi:hypothetical protein